MGENSLRSALRPGAIACLRRHGIHSTNRNGGGMISVAWLSCPLSPPIIGRKALRGRDRRDRPGAQQLSIAAKRHGIWPLRIMPGRNNHSAIPCRRSSPPRNRCRISLYRARIVAPAHHVSAKISAQRWREALRLCRTILRHQLSVIIAEGITDITKQRCPADRSISRASSCVWGKSGDFPRRHPHIPDHVIPAAGTPRHRSRSPSR